MIQRKKTNAYGWMLRYSKKHMKSVILIALLNMLIAFSFLMLALLSKQVIDIATGRGEGDLIRHSLYFCGIIALQAGLNILSSNLLVRAKGNIEISIKQGVFCSVMRGGMPETDKFHSGEYINRLTSDTDIVVNGITSLLPQLLSMTVKLGAGLTILFYLDAKFTAVLLAFGAVSFMISLLFRRKYKGYHKEVQARDGRTRAFMQEGIENLTVIKAFFAQNIIENRLLHLQKDTYQARLKRNTVNNLANTGVYVMFSGGYYLTLIWGALQLAGGRLSYGSLTAFLQIFSQIIQPLKSMSGMLAQYFSMLASAERLMEIDGGEQDAAAPAIEEATADIDALYRKMTCIRFEQISFHYNDTAVFDHASGMIKMGGVTAVIGDSGAGKSTLVRLLLGLVSMHAGDILIEAGKRVYKLDKGLRMLFSYVPQGNMLLSGTIKENITFFRKGIDEQEIERASRIACVTDFTEALPDGLNTVIGEHGIGLSEGQNQRIAIARAIVFKAPVLLLDEATSALDTETERRLLHNLKQFKDKTCIFITHRETVAADCDSVIKIENRKIVRIS